MSSDLSVKQQQDAAALQQQQQQQQYLMQLYQTNPQLYAYWIQQQQLQQLQQQQQPTTTTTQLTPTPSVATNVPSSSADSSAAATSYTPEQLAAYWQQYQYAQYAQLYAQQQQQQQQQQQPQQQHQHQSTVSGDDASKDEIKPPEPQANHMELWRSDTTMNLPEAVYKNVRISGFFIQELRLLQTFDEVVNVAKKNIKYCEPWIGQSTNPSALWCVLWKCFKLRLTRRQVESLLRSQQSPYLRALGLLYIRFCALPETQWELYDSLIYDDDEITLTAVSKTKCTIGQLTRDLIVKVKIFDVIMPRIPVPIHKRWLESLGLLTTTGNKARDRDRSQSPPRARARSRSPTK